MSGLIDIRRIAIVLVAGIVLAAAVVPVCQMAVCDMGSPVHAAGVLSALCTMPATDGAIPATAAGNPLSVVLALVGVIALGSALSAHFTPVRSRTREVGDDMSPPLRDSQRGVRLIV